MRTVEMNTNRIPAVVAKLTAIKAAQPASVCGGFQVWVTADATTNSTSCATTEYHVVSRASAPTRYARVTMSTPVRRRRRAEPIGDPGERQAGGMRADHDRQPAKRHDRADGALPAQSLKAGCRSNQPGQQWISEIGEDRGRHVDRFDRLEQTEDEPREQHADAERYPAHACVGARLRAEAKPCRHERETDHAAKRQHGEHVAAGPMMTLASTSEIPSAIAAASPGAAGKDERKAKGGARF